MQNHVGGSIIGQTSETNNKGDMIGQIFEIIHEFGEHLDKLAQHLDVLRAFNPILFPLPGLAEVLLSTAV